MNEIILLILFSRATCKREFMEIYPTCLPVVHHPVIPYCMVASPAEDAHPPTCRTDVERGALQLSYYHRLIAGPKTTTPA